MEIDIDSYERSCFEQVSDSSFSTEQLARSDTDQKTHDIFLLAMAKSPNGSGRIDFEASWGDPDEGLKWGTQMRGDISDNDGNRIEFKVHQNSDGEGGISAGYEREGSKQK
jgi:hypothetical protein